MDCTTCVLSFLFFIILVPQFRSELFSVSKGKNGTKNSYSMLHLDPNMPCACDVMAKNSTKLYISMPCPPKDSNDADGVEDSDDVECAGRLSEHVLLLDQLKKDSHTMEHILNLQGHNGHPWSNDSYAFSKPSSFTRVIPIKHDIFMVVPNIRHDKRKDMWIFMKPLSWDLWLTMGITSIFVGLAIRFLECRVNSAEFGGSLHQQLFMLFWIPFSSLFHKRQMANKWSKLVVFIWLSIAFVVMQCYVTMLTSSLTENQQQQSLPKQYNYVGYRKGSFVKEVLMEQFGFTKSQLKSYSTIDEYPAALSRGNQNAGVNAIFDEMQYINLFLLKYHSKYTVIGPISKATGFGFAFPTGSHYQYHFPSQYQPITDFPQSRSISAYSFGGLFIIAVIAIIIAIVCSEYSLWKTPIQTLPSIESPIESAIEMINVSEDMPIIDHQVQEHPPASNQSNVEASINEAEEDESL